MATNRNIINKFTQSCTLAVPAGPCRLTFALRQLENRSLLYKSHAGHPRFYRLRALGFLQNSLTHTALLWKIPFQVCYGQQYPRHKVNNNTVQQIIMNHLIIPYLPRLNSFEHTGLVLYLQAYKLQRGECFIREKTTT